MSHNVCLYPMSIFYFTRNFSQLFNTFLSCFLLKIYQLHLNDLKLFGFSETDSKCRQRSNPSFLLLLLRTGGFSYLTFVLHMKNIVLSVFVLCIHGFVSGLQKYKVWKDLQSHYIEPSVLNLSF